LYARLKDSEIVEQLNQYPKIHSILAKNAISEDDLIQKTILKLNLADDSTLFDKFLNLKTDNVKEKFTFIGKILDLDEYPIFKLAEKDNAIIFVMTENKGIES